MIGRAKSLVRGLFNNLVNTDVTIMIDQLAVMLASNADVSEETSHLEIYGTLAERLSGVVAAEHAQDDPVKPEIKTLIESLIILSKELDIAYAHAEPDQQYLRIPKSAIADIVNVREGLKESMIRIAERLGPDNRSAPQNYMALRSFLLELTDIAREQKIPPFDKLDFKDKDEAEMKMEQLLSFAYPPLQLKR